MERPKRFETTVQTSYVFESLLHQVIRRPKATVAVVAIDHDRGGPVGLLQELVHGLHGEMEAAVDVGFAVAHGIADVHEQGAFFVEERTSFQVVDAWDVVHSSGEKISV